MSTAADAHLLGDARETGVLLGREEGKRGTGEGWGGFKRRRLMVKGKEMRQDRNKEQRERAEGEQLVQGRGRQVVKACTPGSV